MSGLRRHGRWGLVQHFRGESIGACTINCGYKTRCVVLEAVS